MDLDNLYWKIKAGDQIGESPDDQKCGDHYIEKGLECHDGDAHRPTPGKNPYWKDGRRGPGDKSKSGDKGSSGKDVPRDRDREGRTEKEENKGRKEEQVKFAVDRFDHYADMMEENDPAMTWTPEKKYELIEMVMRDTAREFSLDSDELGFTDPEAIHYGPLDNYLSSRDRGRKGRALWRPRKDEEHGPGTDVFIPPKHRGKEGLIHDVERKTRDPKSESSLASKLLWGKMVQDRRENMYGPDDVSVSRPCYPGEDPEKGKCNPNVSPPQPGQRPGQPDRSTERPTPQVDTDKALRKLGPGGTKPGIGLEPKEDPERQQRIAIQQKALTADDGSEPRKTAVTVRKMFGNNPTKLTDDGSIIGGNIAGSAEEAKGNADDAKVALTNAGWDQTYDMGGTSQWRKGKTTVTIQTSEQNGRYGNKFKVSGPKKAAKKKRGFFRR